VCDDDQLEVVLLRSIADDPRESVSQADLVRLVKIGGRFIQRLWMQLGHREVGLILTKMPQLTQKASAKANRITMLAKTL
jgi:hypothetical protein